MCLLDFILIQPDLGTTKPLNNRAETIIVERIRDVLWVENSVQSPLPVSVANQAKHRHMTRAAQIDDMVLLLKLTSKKLKRLTRLTWD